LHQGSVRDREGHRRPGLPDPKRSNLVREPPGAYVEWISPTPLLMVVVAADHLTVADEALAAYGRALEPEKLTLLAGGHFDAYVKDFDAASGAAREWFLQHLAGR
jgi:fermentation-respiration switch protein FrsA (DUF1100 family)